MNFDDEGAGQVFRSIILMLSDECRSLFANSSLTLVFKDAKQEQYFNDKVLPKLDVLFKIKDLMKAGPRSWEVISGGGDKQQAIIMLLAMVALRSGGDAFKIDINHHATNIAELSKGGLTDKEIMKISDVTDLLKLFEAKEEDKD